MSKKITKSLALPVLLLCSSTTYAAQPIDLDSQSSSLLKSYIASPQAHLLKGDGASIAKATPGSLDKIEEVTRAIDFKGTTHIRIQQTHAGYPVWGADAVVHVRQQGIAQPTLANAASGSETDMNGMLYQNLDADLRDAPANVFTPEQANQALTQAIKLANAKYAKTEPRDKTSQLMVYVDGNNKAHWAFLTTLYFPRTSTNHLPSQPNFILDAETLQVYKEWNGVESISGKPKLENADGGGLGGNPTSGRLVYDGLQGDLQKLNIERNASKKLCFLANDLAEVRDNKDNDAVLVSFPCADVSTEHNRVFWDNDLQEVNGGYSPDNDALYAGSIIKSLYKDWYKYDMLTTRAGKPMKLMLLVHTNDNWENAEWDSREQVIYLGDGAERFYPLTSLGVIAHEVSHGFTQQHSNLIYESQSGGLNESFSDMAAMAAEYFAYGKNTWQIGSEISKIKGEALRYLDHPAKDCDNSEDGQCSIENMKDYSERLNVHYSSGIFNRAFYLIATAEDWDVRKAFDVMVQANAHYWTATTTFSKAACGVLRATKDHGYRADAVYSAFKEVGVDTSKCVMGHH